MSEELDKALGEINDVYAQFMAPQVPRTGLPEEISKTPMPEVGGTKNVPASAPGASSGGIKGVLDEINGPSKPVAPSEQPVGLPGKKSWTESPVGYGLAGHFVRGFQSAPMLAQKLGDIAGKALGIEKEPGESPAEKAIRILEPKPEQKAGMELLSKSLPGMIAGGIAEAPGSIAPYVLGGGITAALKIPGLAASILTMAGVGAVSRSDRGAEEVIKGLPADIVMGGIFHYLGPAFKAIKPGEKGLAEGGLEITRGGQSRLVKSGVMAALFGGQALYETNDIKQAISSGFVGALLGMTSGGKKEKGIYGEKGVKLLSTKEKMEQAKTIREGASPGYEETDQGFKPNTDMSDVTEREIRQGSEIGLDELPEKIDIGAVLQAGMTRPETEGPDAYRIADSMRMNPAEGAVVFEVNGNQIKTKHVDGLGLVATEIKGVGGEVWDVDPKNLSREDFAKLYELREPGDYSDKNKNPIKIIPEEIKPIGTDVPVKIDITNPKPGGEPRRGPSSPQPVSSPGKGFAIETPAVENMSKRLNSGEQIIYDQVNGKDIEKGNHGSFVGGSEKVDVVDDTPSSLDEYYKSNQKKYEGKSISASRNKDTGKYEIEPADRFDSLEEAMKSGLKNGKKIVHNSEIGDIDLDKFSINKKGKITMEFPVNGAKFQGIREGNAEMDIAPRFEFEDKISQSTFSSASLDRAEILKELDIIRAPYLTTGTEVTYKGKEGYRINEKGDEPNTWTVFSKDEPGNLKIATEDDIRIPEIIGEVTSAPGTSEKVQGEIDTKIEGLIKNGTSFEDAARHPEVEKLYTERDRIDRDDLGTWMNNVIKNSKLHETEAKKALSVLIPDGKTEVYFAGQVIKNWGFQTEKNLSKLYNHFSGGKSDQTIADFKWGGTADDPILQGALISGREFGWDRDALENTEKLFNAISKTQGLDPISLERAEFKQQGLEKIQVKLPTKGVGAAAGGEELSKGRLSDKAYTAGVMAGRKGMEVTEDVKAEIQGDLKKTSEKVRGAWDGIKRLYAPGARGEVGKRQVESSGKGLAEMERSMDIFDKSMEDATKSFDKMTTEEQYAFSQNASTGKKQASEALDKIEADAQRTMTDIGTGINDIAKKIGYDKGDELLHMRKDYWPGVMEETYRAKEGMTPGPLSELRVFEPAGFLKQKIFQDFNSAIEAGYVPKDPNPIRGQIRPKLAQESKIFYTYKMIHEGMQRGDIVRLDAKDAIPLEGQGSGWEAVPGPYGVTKLGKLMMKDEAAQVFKNWLSRPISSSKYFGDAYKAYMNASTLLQRFQLFGFFHGGFMVGESVVGSGARALKQGFRVLQGKEDLSVFLKSAAQVPAAPILKYQMGKRIAAEWNAPGTSTDPRVIRAVQDIVSGGGGLSQEKMFTNLWTEGWKKDLRDKRYLSVAFKTPVAAMEIIMKPLMQGFVPNLKLGAFEELSTELRKVKPGLSDAQYTSDMRQVWNRIDSRLGQIRWQRLFMNNTAKNLIQMIIRAPGWTGGTIAEIGGAPMDVFRFVKEWHKNGKMPEVMPDRVAYVLSLAATTMVANAALSVVVGGKDPDKLIQDDYMAFDTGQIDEKGNSVRGMLPLYSKDVYAYKKSFMSTIWHKTNPIIGMLYELSQNKDYYGTGIVDPSKGQGEKIGEIGSFLLKAFAPFGLRGAQKLSEETGPAAQKYIGPAIGIMPAPASFSQSKATQRALELGAARMPVGGRTKEEYDRNHLINVHIKQYMAAVPKGQAAIEEAMAGLQKDVESGKLKQQDLMKFKTKLKKDSLETSVARLSIKEAMSVWRVANDEEKRKIVPLIFKKYRNLKDPRDKQEYAKDIEKISNDLSKIYNLGGD